ncbi:MAG TPA: hypothetical protein VNP96_09245 [Solirubrobacterales bacterium]|nr:hypothetical protein [Solirubrobacterales bacterium]
MPRSTRVRRGNAGNSATATPLTETIETGSGENPTKGPDEGNGAASLDPTRDGNSRATAKRLPANRPIYSSIAAGNDEDWYVYEAPKDETATVEVATAGADASGRLLIVELSEGLEEIESSADVTDEYPLLVPWEVTAGTRLFVYVHDLCPELGGCSVGPYKVDVRTSPPG